MLYVFVAAAVIIVCAYTLVSCHWSAARYYKGYVNFWMYILLPAPLMKTLTLNAGPINSLVTSTLLSELMYTVCDMGQCVQNGCCMCMYMLGHWSVMI